MVLSPCNDSITDWLLLDLLYSPVGLTRSDLFNCVISRNWKKLTIYMAVCWKKGFFIVLIQMLKHSHLTPPNTLSYLLKGFHLITFMFMDYPYNAITLLLYIQDNVLLAVLGICSKLSLQFFKLPSGLYDRESHSNSMSWVYRNINLCPVIMFVQNFLI